MTKEQLRQDILESKEFLWQFLQHPLKQMKQMPDWTWQRLLIVLMIIASSTGILSGLLEKKVMGILAGLVLSPVLSLISLMVACVFFYYVFQIFADKTVSFRHLFTIVLFANIPQFILNIAAGYIPPISLVGMAFTAMLLSVGFVENFQLPKKLVLRIVGVLYLIFFLIWIWGRISSVSKLENSWHEESKAPEVHLGQ